MSCSVDSTSEDEITYSKLGILSTRGSNTRNRVPTRKARGTNVRSTKTAINAKTRSSTRQVGAGNASNVREGSATAATKAPDKRSRKAPVECKGANGSDTEEVDNFENEEQLEQRKTSRRGRPTNKKAQDEGISQTSLSGSRGREATGKKQPKAKTGNRTCEPVTEVEHTSVPEPPIESDTVSIGMGGFTEIDEISESMPLPSRPSARRAQVRSSKAGHVSTGRLQAGSTSDLERDPSLRRKAGDLSRKLNALTVKYNTLKEVASSEKESNFDQLKKRTEQAAKDQDVVIKTLKQQIVSLQSRILDQAALKKELAQALEGNAQLTTENSKLNSLVTTLQNENKSLSTKLVAARSSVPPENKVIIGSAVKPRSLGVVLPGTAEAVKEAQLARQKVNLYSDLTDLVILGMKRNEHDEDVHDCLQTGRNGTLHFHLTVTSESESYEDTEFIYQPLLDEERDKELLDLLPDYLTEEICFSRGQAAKFYCKVVDSMSKNIVLEED